MPPAASVQQIATANKRPRVPTLSRWCRRWCFLPVRCSPRSSPPETAARSRTRVSAPPLTPNVVDDHAGGSRPARTVRRWPSIIGVLTARWLVVSVVQSPDGSTEIRVDVQVVWMMPRPASEVIPPDAHLLRVSVNSTIKSNQPHQRPLCFTSVTKIDEIVALLNSLPAAQPGLRRCPVDFGITVRLVFYARRGTKPLALAEIDPEGCGGVTLALNGGPESALASDALPPTERSTTDRARATGRAHTRCEIEYHSSAQARMSTISDTEHTQSAPRVRNRDPTASIMMETSAGHRGQCPV